MNKKLTTIMLAVLFILIGKVDSATLTQYIGEHYISQTVNEGQTVRLRFINQSNYTFTNWTVESGNVTIDTTNPTITFTMPSSDVVIRGNYAEEAATPQGTTLASVAEVGAYVTYVPSSASYTVPTTVSGYTSDQIYNPSNTTSWRVLSNDGENIEIISTDSVGDLYLSGADGYINAVQTLNDMSRAFVNSTYAKGGRSLGYYDETRYTSDSNSGSTMTETELTNYKTINTTSYPLTYNVSGFPYKDYQFNPDETALDNNGSMYHSSGYVWLASRYVTTGSDSSEFVVRRLNTSGVVYINYLYRVYNDSSADTINYCFGVRPIVSLKSNITVTGTGTEDDPYVINETNPSQYTVTYNANGGYGEMMPQSVARGSSITLNTNTYEHHSLSFLGWATDATATTATYTNGQAITPTADMTLYAVWVVPTLADVAEIGAYVTYVPSSTSYTVSTTASGYTVDQTYNPSSITSWRVFSNDGINVEIISTDSVGSLWFRTATGYTNFVQTLNDMSASYVNNAYATSGRSLGYYDEKVVNSDGTLGEDMTETQQTNYKTIDTSLYPLNYGVSETIPYEDYQYMPDKAVLDSHGSMYHSSEYVWLASRGVANYSGDGYSSFYLHFMSTSGTPGIYTVHSTNGSSSNSSKGVRPIVTLKSGLTITGGSGTAGDPYILNAPDVSITYNANGGSGTMEVQTAKAGDTVTLVANDFTKDGDTFLGWSTDATATSAMYADEEIITPTEDMTLYAVWGQKYTITYNANGGSGTMESQTVISGESVTLRANTFTKSTFYKFSGWSTSAGSTTVTYTDGQTITPTSDMTLYAVWTFGF